MSPDGLDCAGAAGDDLAHDIVGMRGDGAASLVRRLGQTKDDAAAGQPDRLDDFAAAVADASDDVVGMRPDGVGHDERGLGQPVGGALRCAH